MADSQTDTRRAPALPGSGSARAPREDIKSHPTWGAWYWTAALLAALALFLPAEIFGLATNPANTLSDFSRWQLAEYPGEPAALHAWPWFASQAAYVLIVMWLWGHIWYYLWG
jgi:hypothetical protein